jgi:hypothetical protein
MNNILATGFARYNAGNITNNISFENQSTIVGEFSGQNILDTATLFRNFYNTFVGYKAGQNSINVSKNIFVGFEAGLNVYAGSNNIIIGKNADNDKSLEIYDIISIGNANYTENNSISLGTSNINSGYQNISIGLQNNIQGLQNMVFGNKNYLPHGTSESLIIGNNNLLSSDAISSNIIIIGNKNFDNSLRNFYKRQRNLLANQ